MLKRLPLLALFIVLALLVSACQFGNINIQPNASGSVNVTVTLSESDVNGMVQNALASTGSPLLRDPRIDLQPGQIVINGTHDRRDGGGTVSGSVNVSLSVSGGKVAAQITAASIEGVPLSDGRISELNQRLAERFGERINREGSRAQVSSISISDSSIQIVITVTR